MTIKALLAARDVAGAKVPLQEEFEFLVVPNVGEHMAIIELGRDLLVEVTNVTHLPKGPNTAADKAEVHIWGAILDYNYQA